jgi:hypothetical protein
MTPIIQARIVWMHADAAPENRQLARDICLRHVEFFIAATFTNKYLRPLTADSQNSHQMADEFFSFRGGS